MKHRDYRQLEPAPSMFAPLLARDEDRALLRSTATVALVAGIAGAVANAVLLVTGVATVLGGLTTASSVFLVLAALSLRRAARAATGGEDAVLGGLRHFHKAFLLRAVVVIIALVVVAALGVLLFVRGIAG